LEVGNGDAVGISVGSEGSAYVVLEEYVVECNVARSRLELDTIEATAEDQILEGDQPCLSGE